MAPYPGSIRRIDGVIPSDPNHYLWPLNEDWYWANKTFGHRCSNRWHFSAVALADGRWLTNGFVHPNEADMRFFPTRHAALRHSAADMLWTIRAARAWPKGWSTDRVSPDLYVDLVKWTFDKLELPSPTLSIKAEPTSAAPQPWDDLPIFAALTCNRSISHA